jgi:hypothetical protein
VVGAPPAPTAGSGKVPTVGQKTAAANSPSPKHTLMAAAAPHLPAPAPAPTFAAAPASGKQKRASLAAANANPPSTAVVPAARGTGKMMAAAATSAQAVAVAVAAPAVEKRKGRADRKATGAQTALRSGPAALPRPLAVPDAPRGWINLHGPEISSLGKFGLGLSAVEACWGLFLLMLAGVEVVLRGDAQKPYFLMALIWLVIIAIVCTVGGQALVRPVYRRGRLGRLRRSFQAFGLLVYALVLHGVGLWGLVVFGTGRPDSLTAIVAFVLFAVNVFVAGVLSLANTLG